MKLKYLYQLLLSHFSVLIIAVLLLWLLFSSFVENFIYENEVEELSSFGVQILNDLTDPTEVSPLFLKHYSDLLQARQTRFYLFDQEGTVVGAKDREPPQIKLTEKEWARIQHGNSISVKHDLQRFDQAVTLVAMPYMNGGEMLGGVVLASPISGTREIIHEINQLFWLTVLLSLLVTFLLSWILSKYHVKRIERIRQAISMIGSGNYNINIPFSGYDEIGGLVDEFNKMGSKLLQSHEEIEVLENRRRQFIADVSHELRTPLTTISGLMEGLQNNLIRDAEKERSMSLIRMETKRLLRLVNENLDYEKIRSNQIKLHKEMIPLKDILEIIQEQLEWQAKEKNNEILIETDENVMIFADYDRLVQILINIVKNSIQFTENGFILIKGTSRSGETIVEIEDTGIGIKPEEIEAIWRRFYKADLSRSSNPYGEFGLGLSIVQKIVEMHRGNIRVESKLKKGTKFTIRFPLHGINEQDRN